jgi:hypothetical protein
VIVSIADQTSAPAGHGDDARRRLTGRGVRSRYEWPVPDSVVASLESWLRSNGAPALVSRRGLILAISGPFLLIGFMVRSLVETVLQRSSLMLQVVPLLLVALTLSFFSTEVWQTIGTLHGLPLVLTTLLFVGLAAAFVTRQSRPDLERLATFTDADEVRAALPERITGRLVGLSFDQDAAPPLHRRERTNLVVISVLSQVVTAAVIGLIIFVFFVVLGVLAVDRAAIVSWLAHEPRVAASWTLVGHEYVLTNELLRVSAFLGAFTGFYFIVSSSTDAALRAELAAGHEQHIRACLAVRHACWELAEERR